MASYTWTSGTSGDWNTAADWTPAAVPGAADDVTIDAPTTAGAPYTVTIAAGEVETVNSLTMNSVNNLAGSNHYPYNAAELELDGTLAFAAGSAGLLDGSLQTFVHVSSGQNASIINAGTLNAFIQVEGNLLVTGTNGVYITNDVQALSGTVTFDTKSIAEMNGNVLFDGIFEAKGQDGLAGVVNLGGAGQGLLVNIATIEGPPLNPSGWTELTWFGADSAINEWNGTTYVSVETTLQEIMGAGTVDVLSGRDYTTTKTLTVDAGTGGIVAGMLNLQAGTVTTGGLDINGGIVQGSAKIVGGVANNGTLMALGGTLNLTGNLTGTGVVAFDFDAQAGTIDTVGATLGVNSVSAGQTIVMNGNDTLLINALADFGGTIEAKVGDQIALNGVIATSAVLNAGMLTVLDGTQTVGSLHLAGSYTGEHVNVTGSTLTFASGALTPTISGAAAGQTVTDQTTIKPFSALVITDPNANQTEALSVKLSNAANGTLTNLGGGSYNAMTGVYTVSGSAAQVTAAVDGLVFNPTARQVPVGQTVTTTFTISDTDTAGATANNAVASVASTAAANNFTVLDTTTSLTTFTAGQVYDGPVAGLNYQCIDITTDSLNITSTVPNSFLRSGSGMDGLNVSQANGNNILDGSTGSNFLTGGNGNDTFYMDFRDPTAPVFSTVVNFHSGDNATVWGVNPTDFSILKLDNQGAAGFTGVDLIFSSPGHAAVSFVLAGYISADLSNSTKLSMSYGTTPDLPGLPGSQYLTIHAN